MNDDTQYIQASFELYCIYNVIERYPTNNRKYRLKLLNEFINKFFKKYKFPKRSITEGKRLASDQPHARRHEVAIQSKYCWHVLIFYGI